MSWLRQLYYRLPPVARRWARRVVYLPLDALDLALGRNQGYPPRGKIFTGLSHFRSTGDRFLGYFVTYGQLKPEGQVLDIGSGIGRMAIPLSRYLSTKGRYEGFDIVAAGIHWCRKHLSSRYPHFTFTLVNLENDLYTSQGAAADSFVFPYPNDQFDLAILTSVFTHMLPREVENYLSEISRTLTPGGRCLATFFIVNQEVTDYMAAKGLTYNGYHHEIYLNDPRRTAEEKLRTIIRYPVKPVEVAV
ncbi:MAG: methyltransferase domain-containing protein [Bacteroidota bacterium]